MEPARGSGSQRCVHRDVVLLWPFTVLVSELPVCHQNRSLSHVSTVTMLCLIMDLNYGSN